jgi:hypothetical protein
MHALRSTTVKNVRTVVYSYMLPVVPWWTLCTHRGYRPSSLEPFPPYQSSCMLLDILVDSIKCILRFTQQG